MTVYRHPAFAAAEAAFDAAAPDDSRPIGLTEHELALEFTRRHAAD
jgi:hypothetical protein